MKIVLNAILAKPSGMGGFNVTKNFFYKTLEDHENEWFYFVSKELDAEINGFEKGLDGKHYFVFHSQPNLKHFFLEKSLIRKAEAEITPDVVYSILAPSYFRFRTVEVMRCANAWTVVGGVNPYALKVTPLKMKIRHFVKSKIIHFLMRKTRYFVTQSQIAKRCILQTVDTSPENVCVVSNVLSEKIQKINVEKKPHSGFNMVYVSSPSVHKDYLILPQVASILVNKFGMKDFRIHVTIPNYAYSYAIFNKDLKVYGVEDYFVNHGFLNLEGLANLYSQCDLGLFPSLLETFSATLLEYMFFKLPIVASDLDFNKEVAEDAAIYFKPHNAEDFAEKVYKLFTDQKLREVLVGKSVDILPNYSNNANKYGETISFLRKVAQKSIKNNLNKRIS
ncbi:MAG: glycosyltransferase [Bacteroidaceae bacterium]|nr:glycosyltransferase [Bacteroidaceae bacterium]